MFNMTFVCIVSLFFFTAVVSALESIDSESLNKINADPINTKKGTHVHMESMKIFPWASRVKRADPDTLHEVVIAIEHLNMDYLEKSVNERSTPGNKLFQQWMTFDQVGQLTTNREGFNVVQNWILSENVTITWTHEYLHYIKATAPVSVWERMLKAEFHEWKRDDIHVGTDSDTSKNAVRVPLLRSSSYSVPHAVAPYISAVFNTVQMPPRIQKHFSARNVPGEQQPYKTDMVFHDRNLRTPKGSKTIDLEGTSGSNLVTVTFLDNYYQIPSNKGDPALEQVVFATAQSTSGTSQGNYFAQSDLNISLGNLGVTGRYKIVHNHNTSKYSVAGTACYTGAGSLGTLDCNEGNLDVQYIMGLAQQVSTVYWYIDTLRNKDPFLEIVTELFSSKTKSTVVSISYGSIEQEVSTSTLRSFQSTIVQVLATGVTVIASSGDDGVANYGCNCNAATPVSSSNCACQQDSGSQYAQTHQVQNNSNLFPSWTGQGYFPSFPASCPYVTAVGATQGKDNLVPQPGEGEQSCQSQLGGVITSGGGFSAYYRRPAWQDQAVQSYFTRVNSAGSKIQPAPGFNPNGRGYPDVSLLGVAYSVYINAAIFALYGTSASAPAFAAIGKYRLIIIYRKLIPIIIYLCLLLLQYLC